MENLYHKIIARINEEERFMRTKQKLIIFSLGLSVSIGTFLMLFPTIKTEFMQSGFYEVLTLVYSDFGLVLTNWQDYSLALLESLPISATISFMLISLVFIWTLKRLTETIKTIQNNPQLINY